MIRITSRWIYRLCINCKKTIKGDSLLLSCYTSYLGPNTKLFKTIPGHTIQINLEQDGNDILMGFKSNTRNEVRRGIKDGLSFRKVEDINEFVDFYNNFAKAKNLKLIQKKDIEKYPQIVIFASLYEGKTLTMHANFIDNDLQMVSLLYSASIRLDENVDKKYVGISNRYLHYMEFLEFQKMGLKTYDFSGVCEDENNHEEYSIGQFKKGFGGELKIRYTLYSYPMWILLKLKGAL